MQSAVKILYFCVSLFVTISVFNVAAEAKTPKVLASIKPIHALVAGVMQGVSQPQLLIDDGGSPHGYSLKPSQRLAIENADIIFWVGPSLESFLKKPLSNQTGKKKIIQLLKISGLHILQFRDFDDDHDDDPAHSGEASKTDEHAHETEDGEDEEGHHHHHSGADPHIWLDPDNAIKMVKAMADILSEFDPDHRHIYQRNAAHLNQTIASTSRNIKSRLAGLAKHNIITFHDAYQYFETRFGLNTVGTIVASPEHKAGAKHIRDLRREIDRLNVKCVFSETNTQTTLTKTVIEGFPLGSTRLDPLGNNLEAGPNLYIGLLNTMADSIADCIKTQVKG